MPRFFFDVTTPDLVTVDSVGHECQNLDEARKDALGTLVQIFPFCLTAEGPQRFEIVVRDENRRPLLRPSIVVDPDAAV